MYMIYIRIFLADIDYCIVLLIKMAALPVISLNNSIN